MSQRGRHVPVEVFVRDFIAAELDDHHSWNLERFSGWRKARKQPVNLLIVGAAEEDFVNDTESGPMVRETGTSFVSCGCVADSLIDIEALTQISRAFETLVVVAELRTGLQAPEQVGRDDDVAFLCVGISDLPDMLIDAENFPEEQNSRAGTRRWQAQGKHRRSWRHRPKSRLIFRALPTSRDYRIAKIWVHRFMAPDSNFACLGENPAAFICLVIRS